MNSSNASTPCNSVPARRTYRVEEIAAILEIGRSSAYALVKQGHFISVKIGSVIRISKKSFDEWLDGQDSQDKGVNPYG